MNVMSYANAPEKQYADKLVGFVTQNPNLNNPELWTGTTTKEFGNRRRTLELTIPFDSVFKYDTSDFSSWAKFREKFFTPEARLVRQIMAACKEDNLTMSLLEAEGTDSDLFDYNSGEQRYQSILRAFKLKGMTSNPEKKYSQAQGTRTVKFGDVSIDLPSNFYNFENLWAETAGNTDYANRDAPHVVVFNGRVPRLFMVGYDNERPEVKIDLDSGAERTFANAAQVPFDIAEKAGGRYQTIDYVFAEEAEGIVTPRMFGWQEMIVGKRGVLPSGHRTQGSWHIFLVPQEDMSKNDTKTFKGYKQYSGRDAGAGLKKISELEAQVSTE
jgi:hypothetical protein